MKGRRRLDFSDAHSRLRQVFYIHCPGYLKENWLRREIIKFGGKIEGFLSKDVHVLITNQQNSDRGSSHSNAPPTHLSPLSACTSSSRMWADSPLSTEPPGAVVMTRGKALAMQAAKTQCNGSTDVVENSKRLGVRVWSLESAVRAVRKARREDNRRFIRSPTFSKLPTHCAKTLKPPFLKVEDSSNRFKPLYMEFDDWPIMDYLDKMNLDPGFDHGKLITPLPDPSHSLSPFKSRIQPLLTIHRLSKQELRLSPDHLAPPLPPPSPAQLERGQPKVRREKRTKTPGVRQEQRGILKKQMTERRGYCEACLTRYSCIQEHRRSVSHQEFIANSANFSRLDRVISEFPTLDQLVENFSSVMSIFSDSLSDSTEEVTSSLQQPYLSPTYSVQHSPYTPSKVWDSARHTPQTCISFRPEASLLSYTPYFDIRPTSPLPNHPTPPNLFTTPDMLSRPRVLRPVFPLPTPSTPAEEVKRSYTIPIDTPSHGVKPEITLLIPTSSPAHSAMEWCESIAQLCPPVRREEAVPTVTENNDGESNPDLACIVNEEVVVELEAERTTSGDITPDQTPNKETRDSYQWLQDGKTPPLPKDMDPRLFKFISYPYRQSKVDAFKKLSKIL